MQGKMASISVPGNGNNGEQDNSNTKEKKPLSVLPLQEALSRLRLAESVLSDKGM